MPYSNNIHINLTDSYFLSLLYHCSEQVQVEDNVICERVQKGMRSRSFTHGRYAPLLEHAMHDFHVRLSNDYNSGTSV